MWTEPRYDYTVHDYRTDTFNPAQGIRWRLCTCCGERYPQVPGESWDDAFVRHLETAAGGQHG